MASGGVSLSPPPEAAEEVGEDVWAAYGRFLASPPETVLEWHDPESPARGWLALNSLRGGAAGGGTRMRAGLDREEVVYLAKVMELKFSVSGPSIGGAKAGLDFDPDDPRKRAVLGRWFDAVRPLLESRWGTAGDLNVDEAREVVPLCEELGVAHPQQGVLRGHFGLGGATLRERLTTMRRGLEGPVPHPVGLPGRDLGLSDLVTGYGVAVAARRLLSLQGRSLEGVRILLEGFGNVGGGAALYLSRWGGRLVGVIDARTALVRPGGLEGEEVESLLRDREGNRLPLRLEAGEAAAARRRFEEVEADLCVCAAASGTVDGAVLDRLASQGVTAIVCGANRPFASAAPGDASLERAADRRFAVVADFVANCGAAHAFGYQAARPRPARPAEVLASVEGTVRGAVDEAVRRAGSSERGLMAAALETALDRVGSRGDARAAGG